MPKNQNSKYIFIIFFLLVILLSFFIVMPFFHVILISAVVAYIFYPVYKYLKKYVNNKNAATAIMVFIILIVFAVPLIFATNAVINDIVHIYTTSKEKVSVGTDGCNSGSITCFLVYSINAVSTDPQITEIILNALSDASHALFAAASSFVLSLPSILINIIIFLFLLFYFIRDGEEICIYIHQILPFNEKFKNMLWDKSEDMFFATIYGGIMLALIQGIFAVIGYYIFHVDSPVFWGLITGFASIIPLIGSGIIWLPLGISKLIDASIAGSSTPYWHGIGLLLYSALIVSTVDNFLKPYVIGHKTGLHPAIVLIGIFGGLALIGPVGIIIGPLVLAFTLSLLDVYKKEHNLV